MRKLKLGQKAIKLRSWNLNPDLPDSKVQGLLPQRKELSNSVCIAATSRDKIFYLLELGQTVPEHITALNKSGTMKLGIKIFLKNNSKCKEKSPQTAFSFMLQPVIIVFCLLLIFFHLPYCPVAALRMKTRFECSPFYLQSLAHRLECSMGLINIC